MHDRRSGRPRDSYRRGGSRAPFSDEEWMASNRTGLSPETVLGPAEGLDFVLISENELLVQFGTRSRPSELFRDDDVSGLIGKVIGELLAAPSPVRRLVACVGESQRQDAMRLLESLVEQGVVSDVTRDPVQQYLGYTFDGAPDVANSRVAIVGAGPIAARVALNMLQQGVARLSLTDDRVTDEMWHRLVPWATSADAGVPAQAALAECLRRAGHPDVEWLDWADGDGLARAVAGCDLIILAVERPDIQLAHAVNRACVRAGRPWLMIMIDGNRGLVGPQFRPPDTACYNDYQVLARAAAPSGAMVRKHRRHLLANRPMAFLSGLPAYADIVAGHGSVAAAHFLLRGTSHLLGRVMIIDFDGMRIDVEDVLKLPRCPVCATKRAAYRPPFAENAMAAE
jgi:bacteriocin biosynthesis cyclodehydratase domain-containing protein